MQSLSYIAGSNQVANPSLMTVQTVRSPGATTIITNTVAGAPTKFYATMGTPHTFTDPVTSEVITIISEATAVDFAGTINAGKVDIVSIAPGYTDLGSQVGDIIILRPVTEWANNLFNVLSVAHNDDGTLKAVTQNPGYTSLTGVTVNTVTYNGNHSYDLGLSADTRATLSPGTRLRTTRTVAAPTQCTSLNGSSQYYTKASPAGMSAWTALTITAWVKLSAYGSQGYIVGRDNGSFAGWGLRIEADGRLTLGVYNNTSGNYREQASYQSVPLNRWVHVAATWTGTTFKHYIDGVDVPNSQFGGAGTPGITQPTTPLFVGAKFGVSASLFFAGKIAQVAVFSAALSQATIQSYVSQGLAGTETSLVSAYSFNNSINDLNTTNANNLTANGSAVATNADSPFGGQAGGTISSTLDYAIIQSLSSSVATIQVPEGCTIPTSGGVTSVSYSSVKAPYGFPAQREKWQILSMWRTQQISTTPVSGTWYNPNGVFLSLPVGDWDLDWQAVLRCQNATNLPTILANLSTSASAETDVRLSAFFQHTTISGSGVYQNAYRRAGVSTSTVTPYYLICSTNQASATNLGFAADVAGGPTMIMAVPAYL